MVKGICYGVSVGPGDPELITVKALNLIKNSDIIFLPSAPKENCKVYRIIKKALPDIDENKIVCVDTKAMANPILQSERYDALAKEVAMYLDEGRSVSFPALGEVCLYSTYMYVHERLSKDGYKCVNISGISSVQETANRMAISLAQGDEQVHIFPDTKDLYSRLQMSGTKVFMKPKGDLQNTISLIEKFVNDNPGTRVYGISNCGCENEIVASSATELKNLSGYMTVIIVK